MYKNPATLDLSVIVPLFNEEESLPELTAWLLKVLEPMDLSFEILMVDDGSSDGSWQVVQQLAKDTPQLGACVSDAIMASRPPCTAASVKQREPWSSPWMPIYRTVPMKYRNCDE